MTWRKLEPYERPFNGKGLGFKRKDDKYGLFELCCPNFDTWAEYEVVMVEGLGRAAKQGLHVLVEVDRQRDILRCACGLSFTMENAQRRWVQ